MVKIPVLDLKDKYTKQ